MEDGRLELMRAMILSEDEDAAKEALGNLEPLQRGDFEEIFEAMDGLPVTVRLLDPPLHEFLPDSRELGERLAGLEDQRSEEASELRRQLRVIESLEEANPMLGLRGCRLGLTRPEIYRMQVRAIVEAAKTVTEKGSRPVVEIMIPLVGFGRELEVTREEVDATVREVLGEENPVQIGTMIELPRACTDGRRDRREGRLLLLRDQRSYPDDLRALPRRRRGRLPCHLPREGHPREEPLRDARPGWRRQAGLSRLRAWPRGQPRPEDRHLRGARRRP